MKRIDIQFIKNDGFYCESKGELSWISFVRYDIKWDQKSTES